jgi:UDP-2,3-diacylglucosamine pyrophosphatase LpxH
MITNIRSKKLVVISDLHLGNPFCQSKHEVLRFCRWASREGYDIVINGDGLEIAQTSFAKLAQDVPDVVRTVRQLSAQGTSIWYVVGNHDVALENFMDHGPNFAITPFLNLTSGHKRIRIEHGHLYDPFFVKRPHLYEFATALGGLFLMFLPSLYKTWIGFEKLKSRLRGSRAGLIEGEHPDFGRAVVELLARGFDAVVFGHTHHAGAVEMPEGKVYMNCGSWLLGTNVVVIEDGELTLTQWRGLDNTVA